MASKAQLAANRANAKLSTGPRTEKGKARSARNATRHGLSCQTFIVAADERDVFDKFIRDHHGEIKPEGALQCEIFDQFLISAWNLRRLGRIEAELINPDDLIDPFAVEENARRIQLMMTYRARNERSLHKALAELRRLQEEAIFRRNALRPLKRGEENSSVLVSASRLRQAVYADKVRLSQYDIGARLAYINGDGPPPKTA